MNISFLWQEFEKKQKLGGIELISEWVSTLEKSIAEKYANFQRDNQDKKHGYWKAITFGAVTAAGTLLGAVAAPVGLAVSAIEATVALVVAFTAGGAAGGSVIGVTLGKLIGFLGFSSSKKAIKSSTIEGVRENNQQQP